MEFSIVLVTVPLFLFYVFKIHLKYFDRCKIQVQSIVDHFNPVCIQADSITFSAWKNNHVFHCFL